ncbi:MAG: fatty acid--CoA ligase family protein [Candidatus Eisenbacteria bacterium]
MSLSFLRAAREAPGRTAVVADSAAWSFAEFLPFVNGALRHLANLGLRPGDGRLVALDALPRKETLAFLYALMEWGIPFVPIREGLTAREQREVLGRCGPSFLLDDPLPATRETGSPFGPPEPPPQDDRPLAILHTSGTSGRSKGVVLSRAAFVASAGASAANLGWEERDRWAIALPLAHVGGLSIVTRCLLARRTVVLAGPFGAERLARVVARERVTLLSAVPAMIRRLLDLEPAWRPPPFLRAVLAGGGPLSPALLEEAWTRGIPLLPSYGLTETCSQIAAWPYGTRPPAPVAKALPGAEMRVRDGRLHVRGPMLLTSYFPPDSYPPPILEDGWFDTGDLGTIDDDGLVSVIGRADETVVTGGENVSPREVEEQLERFAGVRAACVFGLRDETWGEVLAAALVLEEGSSLDPDALAAHLAETLAPHKRPRKIACVASLPLTTSGKIDREAVRSLASPLLAPFRR